MKNYELKLGNCLDSMKAMEDNSVDSIVTDPPYGLSFMGKKWDYDVPSKEIWEEALRVLKPGGHLLAFAGTRTQHRMAINIEDAGFEIRDMIAWVYGSGFPKSHNIGKAIDKLGEGEGEYEGWGTALKPALEPITMARKPLSEKTIAKNTLKWGTAGINIDECRVGESGARNNGSVNGSGKNGIYGRFLGMEKKDYKQGRFPANLIHDGSEEVVKNFPNSGTGDKGSASRFFYCAKTSKTDRNEGLEGLEEKQYSHDGRDKEIENAYQRNKSVSKNNHPTVKPTKLMQYLVRLVTPKGGTVLDPFMGSGSTGKACMLEDFNFIGCEMDADYIKIAEARISFAETVDK